MDELHSAFSLFDRTASGSIPTSALISSLSSLPPHRHTALLLSLLSSSPSSLLTFDDFLGLMTARVGEGSSRDDVDRVFALFDEKGKGWLDTEDVERAARLLGERMGAREVREMIERADINGDGVISKDEFYHLMTSPGL